MKKQEQLSLKNEMYLLLKSGMKAAKYRRHFVRMFHAYIFTHGKNTNNDKLSYAGLIERLNIFVFF